MQMRRSAGSDDAERQGKCSMFDLWRFGLDVQQVMTTRVLRMMTGDLSEREARRMVTEKQTAYSHAQIAGADALLTGGPVAAGCEMIEVYQRAVRANCSRLSEAS
jgi:hypothetical protein